MVSRLKRIEELITCEVNSYAKLDNALSDLGYNGKIGDTYRENNASRGTK